MFHVEHFDSIAHFSIKLTEQKTGRHHRRPYLSRIGTAPFSGCDGGARFFREK
jgi:hypothetical protein